MTSGLDPHPRTGARPPSGTAAGGAAIGAAATEASRASKAIPVEADADADAESRAIRQGLWLGALGVAAFAMTIPMTRLASGTALDPQLPPAFVAIGRAAVAGVLALLWLLAARAPWPKPRQWRLLALTAVGIVFGWPLFLGWAVREVDAAHAAVVAGLLPIATAVIGAWLLRQRPSRGFWWAALVGVALVVAFAAWRSQAGFQLADGLLAIAVLFSSWGYVQGARLGVPGPGGEPAMPAPQVISWVLVLSLPITLPLAVWLWPAAPVRPAAWLGFGYVAVVSMWLGFFAWYRALALGGTLRVSQLQLLQPFASILLAAPILGEPVDAVTLLFTAAVAATVAVSRRMPVQALPPVASHRPETALARPS